MLKITKDIEICYDGIRLVKLKEGQDLDVKALLPNPEKAKVFRDRLLDLKVAKEAGSDPKEPAAEIVAKESATDLKEKPENEELEQKSASKTSGKKRGKKG